MERNLSSYCSIKVFLLKSRNQGVLISFNYVRTQRCLQRNSKRELLSPIAMVIRTKSSSLLQDFFPQLKNTDSLRQPPSEVLSLWKAVVSLLSGRITITVR